MCFSAGASFGAGVILSVTGIVSLKRVQKPSQILFAAIPLLFSLQQFTEGFVWFSLTHSDYAGLQKFSTYFYLFFAQVLWPALVPLSILLMEKGRIRKIILAVLTLLGSVMAVYLSYCLVVYPVKAEVVSYHIHYTLDFPVSSIWVSAVFYFIPTVLPSFISVNKRISLLGIMVLASYIFTKIFYPDYFISVWCFFAAFISAVVLFAMFNIKRIGHPSYLRPV